MYQFFIEADRVRRAMALPEKELSITGKDVGHIKNVLRMKAGEEISVSDGVTEKEYRCIIQEIGAEEIRCSIIFVKEEELELPSQVYLFQGLPKGDKMELIIQKAVELGVCEVIPVAAKRSVVKLDEKKALGKIARWQGIAEAAAKQSKRKRIPAVREVMSFKEAVRTALEMDVKVIPYEMAEGMGRTKTIMESLKAGQKIAVFIGPEGGFEESEIKMAEQAGIEPVTLGKRILRTETAGLIVLGWIMYQLECEAY